MMRYKITLEIPNQKVFDLIKSWVQLEVIEETEKSIVVEGRESVIELMMMELFRYCKRRKIIYIFSKVEQITEEDVGKISDIL